MSEQAGENKLTQWKNGLMQHKEIEALLPKYLTYERVVNIAVLAAKNNPLLLQCTPVSYIKAFSKANELGLEPGGALDEAAIVPFRNNKNNTVEAVFIPMYQGLLKLARNTGEIAFIECNAVRENDEFDYKDGTNRFLDFKKAESNRGAFRGVYALAMQMNGYPQFVYLPKEEVDARRAISKARDGDFWVKFYEGMAKKTALKDLCKLLPRSVEMAKAITVIEKDEAGVIDGEGYEIPPEPTATERLETKLTGPEPATPRRGRPPKTPPTTPKPAQDERKPAEAYQDSPPAPKSPENADKGTSDHALEPLRARIRDLAAEKPERFESVLENLFGLPEIQLQNLDEAELNSIIAEMDAE